MSEIRRTNQGGSIVTFIIVGVILAVVLVGGVSYLRQRGEQVRKDQAIAAADQEKAAKDAARQSQNANNSESKGSSTGTVDDNSSGNSNSVKNLPVTGPEATIGALVAPFLLTFASVSYVSSRRSLVRVRSL